MTDPPVGTRLSVGFGFSTVYVDMDFETYSEAGYYFSNNKWHSIVTSPPHGLSAVGASVYSEHPSTEILSLAYDLKNGSGRQLWLPRCTPPINLFKHIKNGGLIEAWNSSFEWHIWQNICVKRMGWLELPYWQLRDTMAKARYFSLPGKLKDAGAVLNIPAQKLDDGKRLINKFSKPRNPTKHNPAKRLRPENDLIDGPKFYEYNLRDIEAESLISAATPDLSQDELELWLLDQCINFRGVSIDVPSLDGCIKIVKQATVKYTAELSKLTNGTVTSIDQFKELTKWLDTQGVATHSVDVENVTRLLAKTDLPDQARRVLEIRSILGSASVKKLFAIKNRLSADGRLKDLFAYCGADRTNRFAGRGPQPQNLPKSGPDVMRCACQRYYGHGIMYCPWCGISEIFGKKEEWSVNAVEDALEIIRSGTLAMVEIAFVDVIAVVSGCLRGLFQAENGNDLICSDYNSIEAVVLAALAGEEWRLEVFRTHGKMYEISAAKITKIPFEEFTDHKERTGEHHPMRNKIGKVAELASGYQGSVKAWKKFGADKLFNSDEEILENVRAWRKESSMIVKFWYGLEDAARTAILNPGKFYSYRDIHYGVVDNILCCNAPGGTLIYHKPQLHWDVTPWGKRVQKITFMGNNNDHIKGPKGWMRLDTYGGKLVENVVQFVSRNILTHGMKRLEHAGYSLVLHVHDEPCAEIVAGTGSIEEFERIMCDLPEWASDWPIKASGGWRGKRYRKE